MYRNSDENKTRARLKMGFDQKDELTGNIETGNAAFADTVSVGDQAYVFIMWGRVGWGGVGGGDNAVGWSGTGSQRGRKRQIVNCEQESTTSVHCDLCYVQVY